MLLRWMNWSIFTGANLSTVWVEVAALAKALGVIYSQLKYTYESKYLNTRSWLVINLHVFCLVSLINAIEVMSMVGGFGFLTAQAMATLASVIYLCLQLFVLVDFSGKFTHSSVLASEGRLFAVNPTEGDNGGDDGGERKPKVAKRAKKSVVDKARNQGIKDLKNLKTLNENRVKLLVAALQKCSTTNDKLKGLVANLKLDNAQLRATVKGLSSQLKLVIKDNRNLRREIKRLEALLSKVGERGVKTSKRPAHQAPIDSPDTSSSNGESKDVDESDSQDTKGKDDAGFNLSTVTSTYEHNNSTHSSGAAASSGNTDVRFRS